MEEERIIIRSPGNLGDVEITRNAERSADALKFTFLDGDLSDVSTDLLKGIRVLTEAMKRAIAFPICEWTSAGSLTSTRLGRLSPTS